jgi:FixJ family two-component response regulator
MSEGLIYLVDDDASVLKAISRLLREAGYEVRAFQSPSDFLEQHDSEAVGCAVFDLAMTGLNGLDLHREMSARGYRRPTIFITGHGDVPSSVQAMKLGAVDFLTKPVHDEDLIEAVRAAVERDFAARRQLSELETVSKKVSQLTPREREVMDHVISGRLNKQIAAAMQISEKTVKVHRARVMAKMAVRSVAELVRLNDSMRA